MGLLTISVATPPKAWLLVGLLGLTVIATGCGGDNADESAQTRMLRGINDPSRGLSHQHVVNGVRVSVRHLPPAYLMASGGDATPVAASRHQSTATFLLTIEAEGESGATLGHNLGSPAELRQRIHDLSFKLADYVDLAVGDSSVRPILANLESDFGVVSRVHFNLVYPVTPATIRDQKKPLIITFIDPTFGTGVHRFAFQPTELAESMSTAL